MTFYLFIWWLCLGLAGLSLLLMSTLVVRRVIGDRAAARRERRKQAMLEWLLDCLVTLVPEQAGDYIESKQDVKILVEVIEHLLRSLRGEERERLIAVLRSLGGLETCLERLRHGKDWQREAAAGSLRYLEGPGIREGLRQALDDPSPGVRCAAARALLHLDSAGSAQLLIDKLIVEAAVPPHAVRDVFRRLGPFYHDELIHALQSDLELCLTATAQTLDLRRVLHAGFHRHHAVANWARYFACHIGLLVYDDQVDGRAIPDLPRHQADTWRHQTNATAGTGQVTGITA